MDPWVCEFCGQVVERRDNGTQTVYVNCALREHYVGNECIAYRDAATATRLIEAQRA
jgi:hypothetical protein